MQIPNQMMQAIKHGRITEIERYLKFNFNPNGDLNLTNKRTTTPLVFALGYASLPNICSSDEKPLDLQKAKKIVHILYKHGASMSFSQNQAEDFFYHMQSLTRGKYLGKENEMIYNMQTLLKTINQVLNAINGVPLFILGSKDENANIYVFPKEIMQLIVLKLHQSIDSTFDDFLPTS